jgi:hypothetical protein
MDIRAGAEVVVKLKVPSRPGTEPPADSPKVVSYLVMVGLLVILSVYVFTFRIRNNYIYSIFIENLNTIV